MRKQRNSTIFPHRFLRGKAVDFHLTRPYKGVEMEKIHVVEPHSEMRLELTESQAVIFRPLYAIAKVC